MEMIGEGGAKKEDSKRRKTAPTAGPEGLKIWDVKGQGDCGMRCIAAQVAVKNGKTIEQVNENADEKAQHSDAAAGVRAAEEAGLLEKDLEEGG